jgi:hypothetical protein
MPSQPDDCYRANFMLPHSYRTRSPPSQRVKAQPSLADQQLSTTPNLLYALALEFCADSPRIHQLMNESPIDYAMITRCRPQSTETLLAWACSHNIIIMEFAKVYYKHLI